MSTYPARPRVPAIPALAYGQNATLEKMPPEILRMIANELGEREETNGMYRSFKTLANFILAIKSLAHVLEEYLYTEDVLSDSFKGFRVLFTRDDELALAVLSKYPVDLIKRCINKQMTGKTNDKKVSWTLLHVAASRPLPKTIVKLHELGALYQDTQNFGPILDPQFHIDFKSHARIMNDPYVGHFGEGHLKRLRWKPGFVPFIKNDMKTYTLLASLWDASTVATWDLYYCLLKNPGNYPMTLQHLAVLGDDKKSMKWTRYAASTYPGSIEAPGGETQFSVLHVAVKANNKEVLKFFLENGIGFGSHFVDSNGNNPFHSLIIQGLNADRAKERSEWKKLRDVFFNTVPRLEWNILMVQTQNPRNSALQLAIEHIRNKWGDCRTSIKEIIKFVLDQEKILLQKWKFPPRSLLINLPNADGDTPLSRLAEIIDNREQSYSKTHWDVFDDLIKHGADINLDVNAIFTPRSYQHSISYQVHKRGRFMGHVTDKSGKIRDVEKSETYPIRTPTNMGTYRFHAHLLPVGNPLNLPVPFSWPLMPLPSVGGGIADLILNNESNANHVITGSQDFILYLTPATAAAIAANAATSATASAAAASAAWAALTEQDDTPA
ncbi:hypothetical protein ACHAP5_006141 [Fusarium lateritium]